jgi:hypothetical protein
MCILSPLTAPPYIDGGSHGDDPLVATSKPTDLQQPGGRQRILLQQGAAAWRRGTASLGGRSSSSLWRRSYEDVMILLAGSAASAPLPCSSKLPLWHENGSRRTTDEHAVKAYFHVSAAPGYVSFEDVISGTALFRDGSGQTLEAAISDPLVRTASQLYAHEDGRSPHCRRQSPGPLGTSRCSAMHAIVKKCVHHLQGFLAGIFCCITPS